MKNFNHKDGRWGFGSILLLVIGISCSSWAQPVSDQHKTWKQYGGGADQSKYMDLKQITRHNVNQLEVVWNYADPSPGGNFFNPIVVDGIMYVVAKGGSIVALDAATGGEKS